MLKQLAHQFSVEFPTPTAARKIGTTKHSRSGCSYTEAAGISRHLRHSLPVSQEYYQTNVTADDSIDTYERIQLIGKRPQKVESEPTPKHWRAWTDEEVVNVKRAFKTATKISLEQA